MKMMKIMKNKIVVMEEFIMKLKKSLSIILAIILVASCLFITAAAENEDVIVSLKGEAQAIVGAEYEVTLNVAETVADSVGGISCDVTYDKDRFTFDRVEISKKFATANGIAQSDTEGKIVKTSTEGIVNVLLLQVEGDKEANNWLKLVFDVKGSAEKATTAWFGVKNAKASNASGDDLIANGLSVNVTENIFADKVNVKGASIRKDPQGNIRFEAEIKDRTNVKEIGFLMLPSKAVNNGDLKFTNDLNDKSQHLYTMANGNKITIASNGKMMEEIDANETKVFCYLKNSISMLNTAFSARAYVKLNDGTYIYSDNIVVDNNIVGGTSSRSCVDVAKAIYDLYKDEKDFSAIESIIANDSWEVSQYETVVKALAAVL